MKGNLDSLTRSCDKTASSFFAQDNLAVSLGNPYSPPTEQNRIEQNTLFIYGVPKALFPGFPTPKPGKTALGTRLTPYNRGFVRKRLVENQTMNGVLESIVPCHFGLNPGTSVRDTNSLRSWRFFGVFCPNVFERHPRASQTRKRARSMEKMLEINEARQQKERNLSIFVFTLFLSRITIIITFIHSPYWALQG